MNLLFKYYTNENKYTFENFSNSMISFSSIDSLNDPFEGIVHYSFQIDVVEKSDDKINRLSA